MNRIKIPLIILSMLAMSFRSDKPAYSLFNKEGKSVSYEKMLSDLAKADIVFLGELHNNSIAHWIELEVTSDLYRERGEETMLGAEMFERDNQLLIDEYLAGMYASDKFEAEVKLWKNYKTDYKPLVEFAKDNHLRFIATNIPRRYASVVSKKGFEVLDSLAEEAKRYIAPLPIKYDPEVKCYKDMLSMEGMPAHLSENLPKAQAIKDATMAWSILENMKEGTLFIHYNGSYHSSNFEGIIWYLLQSNPGLAIKTVEIVEQEKILELEEDNMGIATYVIAVPDNMTRTY